MQSFVKVCSVDYMYGASRVRAEHANFWVARPLKLISEDGPQESAHLAITPESLAAG